MQRSWRQNADRTHRSVVMVAYKNIPADNKKAQLALTNPHDTKACRKLLQFNVKTNCRQFNEF